ncbi:hypothetical protein BSZ36_00980 [Rubricoccus marinus]|uniref:Uncharacterized protein n=2 Tax=Rubricoccus marinus TaxID=716817 RepID=A0A259TVV0_9BACT|nr:hypothetical protein BSZ36_00980 [Rubricoccus marinus]
MTEARIGVLKQVTTLSTGAIVVITTFYRGDTETTSLTETRLTIALVAFLISAGVSVFAMWAHSVGYRSASSSDYLSNGDFHKTNKEFWAEATALAIFFGGIVSLTLAFVSML